MKVVVKYSGKKNDPGMDYEGWCDIEVDGKTVVRAGNLSESPEDANLGRDLSFVYDIPDLLWAAYEAGDRGEMLVIEREENSGEG